jgi:hypothetical protein
MGPINTIPRATCQYDMSRRALFNLPTAVDIRCGAPGRVTICCAATKHRWPWHAEGGLAPGGARKELGGDVHSGKSTIPWIPDTH